MTMVSSERNSLKLVDSKLATVAITHLACTVCGEFKSVTEFYKCKENVNGYRGKCIKCVAVYNRKATQKKKQRKIFKA
jgi:hypothetical protein